MQSLVYIFVAIAGLGVGMAAYYGLTFTPIEAFTIALAAVAIAMLVIERTARRRSEARLERSIDELSRQLSSYGHAGAAFDQRLNALAQENGQRLGALEADISVLGTVVRQVAETMADLEDGRKRQMRQEMALAAAKPTPVAPVEALPATPPAEPVVAMEDELPAAAAPPPPLPAPVVNEAVIPLEMLKQAIDEHRLLFHVQPIVTLPQRKTHGYDLVPRIEMEEGDFADPPDFMPRRGGEAVIGRISWLALEEAITIARRSRTGSQPTRLYVPMSRALLADTPLVEKVLVVLEANRAIAESIVFALAATDWKAMPTMERAALAAFVGKGVGVSLTEAPTLRLDFAALAGDGVHSVRVDAARFIDEPESFTDFHTSDVASYLRRFEVDLIATGIHTEDQILTLLEDGVALATGPRIAGPGPVRTDLVASRPAVRQTPDRAEA